MKRGHDQRARQAGWRRLLAWLGVLALLIHAVPAELAMASQAWTSESPAGEMCRVGAADEPPATPHEHGGACAFCLAQALGGLIPGAGPIPARKNLAIAVGRPLAAPAIVPEAHFLSVPPSRGPPPTRSA